MKEIKNTAVLAIVSCNNDVVNNENNDKEAPKTTPFTVVTLINENGFFELPYCEFISSGSLETQLLDSFYQSFDIGIKNRLTQEQLRPIGTYTVEREEYVEIVNAFVTIVDGKPTVNRKTGDKSPVWMSIDVFEHQALFGNHNQIIKDIRGKLLELALDPSNVFAFGELTRQVIIKKYLREESKKPWIQMLQNSGLYVHEYMHPGIAIDVIIFGYKKAEKGRRDELSILLTYRKKDPNLPDNVRDSWEGWSLPGTFLLQKLERMPEGAGHDYLKTPFEIDGKPAYPGIETVQEAAIRIVKEKTGIEIKEDEELYNIKPFVYHSRMGWKLRDGVPVITLPIFIPIAYEEVNNTTTTVTTSGCKWFPIKRMLWSIDKEVEGGTPRKLLRGGNNPLKLENDGKYKEITNDALDSNFSIERWKKEDWDNNNLNSPEEIGLPAADVYIQDEKLIIEYYNTINRPRVDNKPIQDRNSQFDPEPEDKELLIADHANILLSALQEISENSKQTLHIVSKLLEGGAFSPAEIKRVLETWFFPWIFSRSNMQKKLRDANNPLIIDKDEDKEAGGNSRSWSYNFVTPRDIDRILLNSKPF